MCLNFGAWTIVRARAFWICWRRSFEISEAHSTESYSNQVWSVQWRWQLFLQSEGQGRDGYSGGHECDNSNSALRHQCRHVIQFKINNNINNNNNNNDIFTVFALQINHRTSVTPHITFLVPVVIQLGLLVSRIERHKAWLDCFFGFFSLAIQRLPYFPPHFPVPRFSAPRFLLPRYQRPLNTQHCIYMSLQKLGNEQLTRSLRL